MYLVVKISFLDRGKKSECVSSKAQSRFEIVKEHGRFTSYQTRTVLPDICGCRREEGQYPNAVLHVQSWNRQVFGVPFCWEGKFQF